MFTKVHKPVLIRIALAMILIVGAFDLLPGVLWNTFAGGTGSDEALDIAVDALGNSYVTGQSGSTWGTPLNAYVGATDAYLIKISSTGIREWHTFLGGEGMDIAEGVAVDSNGNIYVTGISQATWGTPILDFGGFYDAFVAKYNNNGVLQWHTFLGGEGWDYGHAIVVDGNDNVYVTGEGGGWGSSLNPNTNDGAFVAKLDSDGALQWNTFFGADLSQDIGYDICIGGSGAIYIVGESDKDWGESLQDHSGYYHDAFIAKLNADGALQWNTFFGSTPYDRGDSIGVDADENIYVSGFSWADWGTPINPFAGDLWSDAMLIKFDGNGNYQWHTFMGSTEDENARDLAVDDNGNSFVIGYGDAAWGTPRNPYHVASDSFMAKINTNGIRQWNTFIGGSYSDDGYGIAVMDGKIYGAGSSGNSWGNPVNGFASGTDSFVVSIDDAPSVSTSVRTNNNPTNLASVNFTVTFSENVQGVGASDFKLTTTGLTSPTIASVSGANNVYTVTVKTGSGDGTIRLDVPNSATLTDANNNPLAGIPYTRGETYTVIKSSPGVPALLLPASGAVVNTMRPVLDWKDSVPAAHHYQVQVSTNNTFTGIVVSDANVLSSTLTIPLDLIPGTLYYWRVKAFNGVGNASAWSSVRNFKTALPQPILVSPTSAEPLLVDRPAFDWDDVNGASQYNLQISALNNFSTLLLNVTTGTSTYSMTKDLPQNKTLYWRVRAKTPVITGPWSAKWLFKTGNPPSVPVLASPLNSSLNTSYTTSLKWKAVTVPTSASFVRYELQVDEDSDFSSPFVDNKLLTEQFTTQFPITGSLESNTKYYWRVRAVDFFNEKEHVSGWSTVWTIRAAVLPPDSLIMIPNGTFPRRPTLEWDDVIGASGYNIQISTTSNFSTLLVNASTGTSTYTVLTNLPVGRKLYWRVRAKGINGPSLWTDSQFILP